ncbi:SDR family NAD(P)-dependent oxidoreductase [Nonomuraea wenchangensis]|uniref:SDR family NAD(P)-dependent oxidoreductase n=1 Tax=Nonomuraea wenchangensis TaxID=568860 RepID=UPI00384E12FD
MSLDPESDIAVIAMECRVPGAQHIDRLWRNLCEGRESITRELDHVGDLQRAGGCVDDLEGFDAGLFRIPPREAELLDPQQRMFLECAWSALEQAGYSARTADMRVGVFGGTGVSTYLLNNVWPALGGPGRPIVDSAEDMRLLLNNDKDFLTGRAAYLLDLTGPSITVQAACATGLYAVHLAAQSLLAGECEIALAGAASATVPQTGSPGRGGGTYVSHDGYTRTFDIRASGSVFGSGAGVVVLKMLGDALRDEDPVRAVIKGSAVNNDGAFKTGLTVPSAHAQQDVIEQAMVVAGVKPSDVGMVEAHGTATPIGDPIEVAALGRALRGADPGSVLLTSLKPNVGHLGWSAGILGFCKAVLCIESGLVTPMVNFSEPNPELNLAGGPLRIATRLEPWNADRQRVAGVSAFGVGGFNAHVLLHAAPLLPPVAPPDGDSTSPPRVIVVSANSPKGLAATAERWAETLENDAPERPSLADLAYTSLHRRTLMPVRRAVAGRDAAAIARALRRATEPRAESPHRIAALFTGYTPHLAGRTAGIAEAAPFRAVVDEARAAMIETAGPASVELLDGRRASLLPNAGLVQRHVAQFVLQCGLLEFWRSCGVRPDIVLGHSLGEYAAAYAAGVLDLPTGVALVALRAELYLKLPERTGMAVLECDEDRAHRLCDKIGVDELEIAALNTPENTVVTGTLPAVERACAEMRAEGRRGRLLDYSRAGHSAWVEPLAGRLVDAVSGATLRPPTCDFVSGLVGGTVRDQLTSPAYWRDQMRRPVRFADAVGSAVELGAQAFLEVGAAPVLSSFVRTLLPDFDGVIAGAPRPDEDPWDGLADALASLFGAGVDVAWPNELTAQGRACAAPTYVFDRQRHWIDGPATEPPDPLSDVVLRPRWKPDPSEVPTQPPLPGRHFLILPDHGGTAEAVVRTLAEEGALCTLAPGYGDERTWPEAFAAEPLGGSDDLSARLQSPAFPLSGVVDLRPLDLRGFDSGMFDDLESGLFALVELLRHVPATLPVTLVTRGAQALEGRAPELGQAPVWAAARSAAAESPDLTVYCIDLDPSGSLERDAAAVADALGRTDEAEWAYRSGRRFVHRLEPVGPETLQATANDLDAAATYVVTGGFGTLGLLTAAELVDRGARNLVLIGRRQPAAEAREAVAHLMERARVECRLADVADPAEVQALIDWVAAEGSWIGGVVHAAGVIDDATLVSMTRDKLRSVFAGKARGGWNLHAALGDDPRLRFFTTYSSVASVLGNAGQVNYAAANGFLDALAEHRVARGAPGLALAWGAWTEVGLLARRPELASALAARGMRPLSTVTGLLAVRRLVPSALGSLAVTVQDWPLWTAPLPANRATFYSGLFVVPEQTADPAAEPSSTDLGSLSPEDRQAAFDAVVREVVREVLGVESTALDASAVLSDLGLDSFRAISLRAGIRRRLGVTPAVAAVLNRATVATLINAVTEQYERDSSA